VKGGAVLFKLLKQHTEYHKAHYRDKAGGPEAEDIHSVLALGIKAEDKLAVRVFLWEKAYDRRDRYRNTHYPFVADRPVYGIVLGKGNGRETHHKYRHIEPAGVIGGVKGVKRAVEHRNKRHKNTYPDNSFKPVTLALRKPCEYADHTEN